MTFLLILYNILLIVFYIPAGLIGFFLIRKKNPHFFQRLGFTLPSGDGRPSLWLHGASVGEIRSLVPLVGWLRQRYPDYAILISTFTETGYDTAFKELHPDGQFLIPFENPFAVHWLIKKHHIRLFIIIETEIWPNTILTVSRKIPLLLLNGRISDKTFKTYKKWSFSFGPLLRCFAQIFTKSEEDAIRFRAVGGSSLSVETGGNIKYTLDNPRSPVKEDLLRFFEGKKIALAASTHYPEEEIFLSCAMQFKDRYDKVLLAPRHIKRVQEIKETAEKIGLSAGLYTDGDFDKDILIIDSFGLLESLYQLADRIFIGGSLADIGGHNVFEALKYGKAVSSGPYIYNFNDLIPLGVAYGVVTIVNDKSELLRYFESDLPLMPSGADFSGFFTALKKQQESDENKIHHSIEQLIRTQE